MSEINDTPIVDEPGPGPDPKDPAEERVPPSEPADAWVLAEARREVDRLRGRVADLEKAGSAREAEAKELRATLERAREALDASERRRRIDQELFEAGTRDVETARLLTEAAVSRMPGADVSAVVRDLRKHKPYLFRREPLRLAGSPAMEASPARGEPLESAAAAARASGDRDALMRYLRARRGE